TRNVSAVGINIGMILTGMNLLKKSGFDLALLYNPYPEQKKNIATIGYPAVTKISSPCLMYFGLSQLAHVACEQ
ncbi:MAG: hypothetical protein J6X92_04675, partial [Bacteroidales bacterium]|nr:hypothetical protein [Bacteroidales bacterium]